MENQLATIFTDSAARRMQQYSGRIAKCIQSLNEDQVWARGSENENAVGNLMLHLAGNVRQWIISGVGGQADVRVRDTEFAARGAISKDEMWNRLNTTVEEAMQVIQAQAAPELAVKVRIQGYEVSKLEAIFHVVEHFALHTGQIIFATKMLTHEDLGFYKHLGSITAQAHTEKTP